MNPDMTGKGNAAVPMAHKWWTLAAVGTATFMLLLDTTIVNTALPSIQREFHSSLANLQWVIDAYALAIAAVLLIGGSLADRFGRRLLFATGISIFTVGSLLCGISTGSLFLALARGLQGVGGGIMFATSLALLGNAFRGKDRGMAFGVYGAITGIAVAIGPLTGGVITTGLSWHWVFLINAPLGVAGLIITLARVGESRDPSAARVDLLGFLTFGGGLAALVYGLIESANGWSTTVVVSLSLAGALLVAFAVAETVQRRPMLDVTLFRKPTFSGGLIAAFAVAGSMFAMITFIILYLQNLLGYSALQAGLRTTPITLAVLVFSTIAGRLTTVIPVKIMIGGGFILVAAGLLLMRGLTADSAWTHLIPGMIACGSGAGLITVPLASTAVGVVDPARGGMASGINATFRQVGLATGIAVYGALFASQLRHGITTALLGTPYAARAAHFAAGVRAGVPPAGRVPAVVTTAIHAGFTNALNEILLVGAIVALVAAVTSLLLIRARDFVPAARPAAAPRTQGQPTAIIR
jgi:EmrB/QacA subfamily drug resistance transporter